MEEKKSVNVKLSTVIFILIIILLIAGIAYFVLQNNNLKIAKTNSENEVSQLQNKVGQLEQTISEVKNVTANVTTNNTTSDNSAVNTNTTNSNSNAKSSSSIEVGYEEIIVILDGKPYVMPIHRPGLADMEEELEERGVYYYNKFEVDNIKSGVKAAYAVGLGTDTSSTIYFVMEDGSVRVLETSGTIPNIKYTSKEVLPASKNVVELKMEGGTLNAITKDGSKIKIAEAMA